MGEIPGTPGLPGDPHPGGLRWSMADYVARIGALLRTLLGSLEPADGRSEAPATNGLAPDAILARAGRFLRYGEVATLAALIEGVALLDTMRVIVRHHLLTDPRGFDAIDDYDCREWLRMNGASDPSLDSGYLRGLYDL